MSLSYLTEAFKSLEILEEEDFNLANKEDVEKLQDFENDQPEDVIEIMSMDFDDVEEAEEENEESHIGDVILDCPICHSKLYKHSDEVVIDEEEQLANVGEECPYCYTADGFKIVGQVAPYQPEDEITVDVEDKEEIEDSDDEVEEDDFEEDNVNESVKRSRKQRIKESRPLKEDIYDDYPGWDFIEETLIETPAEWYDSKKEFIDELMEFFEDYRDRLEADGVDFRKIKPRLIKYWNSAHKIRESKNESKEVDLTEYQKWVDYDMKKYHKISKNTMDKIKSAGLSVVKDQYGDYEVIAKRADSDVNESFNQKLTEKQWQYTLKSGSLLRDAIDEGDLQQVQYALIDCYDELHNNDLIDDDDYESYTEDVRMLDASDEDAEDEFDYQLNEFYDLCDNLNVWVALSESFNTKRKRVTEDFDKVEVETEDQKITVKSEPKEVDSDDQMIAPIEPEVKADIEDNIEEVGEEGSEEEEVDFDVEDFDEESFDEIGESYLRRVYENVTSYKTKKVSSDGNKLVVEGLITFKSKKTKPTSFIFEAKDATKKGVLRFIGENLQISRGHKSFMLKGNLNEGKFLSESLNYNYRTKDSTGKPTRIYGTTKRS